MLPFTNFVFSWTTTCCIAGRRIERCWFTIFILVMLYTGTSCYCAYGAWTLSRKCSYSEKRVKKMGFLQQLSSSIIILNLIFLTTCMKPTIAPLKLTYSLWRRLTLFVHHGMSIFGGWSPFHCCFSRQTRAGGLCAFTRFPYKLKTPWF